MKVFTIYCLLFLTVSVTRIFKLINADEPDEFDVSEMWPECKDIFNDIQAQGDCSSSWAISVASSIRDRRCIKSKVKMPISAYDLISCCSDCQTDGENG